MNSDAAEALGELVDTVTVFRQSSRPGGVAVEVAGRLNAVLGKTLCEQSPCKGYRGSVTSFPH